MSRYLWKRICRSDATLTNNERQSLLPRSCCVSQIFTRVSSPVGEHNTLLQIAGVSKTHTETTEHVGRPPAVKKNERIKFQPVLRLAPTAERETWIGFSSRTFGVTQRQARTTTVAGANNRCRNSFETKSSIRSIPGKLRCAVLSQHYHVSTRTPCSLRKPPPQECFRLDRRT
jgi:hypothetical protein